MHSTRLITTICVYAALILIAFVVGCSDDDDPAGPSGSWDWSAVGSGVNDRVFSFAEYQGMLYVGGHFDTAGGLPAGNIATCNDSTWDTLRYRYNNEVAALVESEGRIVLAGNFTEVNGLDAQYFMIWDGIIGYLYYPGLNGRVYDMCVYDSMLIFAGDFSTGGSTTAHNIVAWKVYGGWVALGTGTDGPVYSVTVHDSLLYAGGHFVHAGGAVANNVAKWNGTNWMPLSGGVSYDADTAAAAVYALECYNDRMYVGGLFSEANGNSVRNIASYALSGWQACGSGVGASSQPVKALAVFENQLIAGGYFGSMGGVSDTKHIAAWNGSGWSALGVGIDGDFWPHVWDLYVYHEKLYAGGRFTIAGTDSTANNIACWSYTPN